MVANTRKIMVGLIALSAFLLWVSGLGAQMKTPNPLDQEDEETTEEGGEESDSYYDEEQAGGINYEDETPVLLDRETIKSVIAKRYQSIIYCYEKELQTNRNLKGRVMVSFTIERNGTVSETEVVKDKSTIKDKKVIDCVLKIMKSMRSRKMYLFVS